MGHEYNFCDHDFKFKATSKDNSAFKKLLKKKKLSYAKMEMNEEKNIKFER